jgi:uncharacterized protein
MWGLGYRSRQLITDDRLDPARDTANGRKHKLPLVFGDQIFEDDNQLIIPSIREIDGEKEQQR